MIGLNGTLSIATEALGAQTAGLEITNNNIANANTPGYMRQVVSLSSAATVQNGASVDDGVSYDGYQSVRDNVLQLAINSATSDQASLTAQNTLLTQINSAFSGTSTGIGASISTLFSDLSSLSTNPADSSARQAVLSDAGELADSFHQGAAALASASSSANQQVTSTVAQINQILGQIATLNGQLASATTGGQDGGSLEDQRDTLVTQLAGLVGVSSIQTGNNPTLTTTNGSPLVTGSTASPLQVTTAADGTVRVLDAQGNDITEELSGGTLGGAIALRDTTLPQLSDQLNTLASQFATAMNSAQSSGFDANGSSGQAMFALPTDGTGAAQGISVSLISGAGVAVSSDGTSGSSGNLQNLLAVETNDLPSGTSPTDGYAAFVTNVGASGSQVSADLTGTTTALQQLTSQQDSESGVSIDEETANLMRYQQAYTAAARVISTVNDMYTVLMNISLGDG
jgi:flagellar hook-associated protein 1 FlgK